MPIPGDPEHYCGAPVGAGSAGEVRSPHRASIPTALCAADRAACGLAPSPLCCQSASVTFILFPGSKLPLVPSSPGRPAFLSLMVQALRKDSFPALPAFLAVVLRPILCPAPHPRYAVPQTWHTFLPLAFALTHAVPCTWCFFGAPFSSFVCCLFLAQIYHVPL